MTYIRALLLGYLAWIGVAVFALLAVRVAMLFIRAWIVRNREKARWELRMKQYRSDDGQR